MPRNSQHMIRAYSKFRATGDADARGGRDLRYETGWVMSLKSRRYITLAVFHHIIAENPSSARPTEIWAKPTCRDDKANAIFCIQRVSSSD